MPREFLAANNDGVDQHLKGSFSHFVNKAPLKASAMHKEWVIIDAENSVSPGGKAIFNIPRNSDYIGRVVLQTDISAVTPSAGTAELQDYVGCRMIRSNGIRATWANNQLQTLHPDDVMKHWALHKTTDNSYAALMRGDLDQAARQALANASTEVFVPLPLFWTGHPKCYLPNNQQASRANMRLEIDYAAKDQYIATPGGTISSGGDLSNVRLWIEYIHVGQAQLTAMLAEKVASNPVLATKGYSRLVTTYENQYGESLSASVAEQTIKLSSIRRPSKFLMFTVVADSDRPSSGEGNTPDHFNFAAVSSYRVQSAGRDLAISRPHRFGLLYETNSAFSFSPSKNIYVLPWSMSPQVWGDQNGYLNFNGLGSANLLITLASATASTCDITEAAMNIYTLGPTGDFRVLYV